MQVPQTEITIRGENGTVLLQKTVPPGDYVLGREPAVELCFQAELVSRRHAQLTIENDQAFIQDLGSSNGTSVNGQPITQITRLWPNQKIQVGSATVELHRVKTVPPLNTSLAPAQAAVQQLLPEELLRERKYTIGKVVAQGGMGAILDARDGATDRSVAMKVMLDASSPHDLFRFIAEARVTAQLEHPNIVPVHELSVDENGQPFYTMKMVRGITLKKVLDLLAQGIPETVKKYPLPALLTLFQKACDAVAFAHSRGVIHRDLKPENIMLGDFGEVLVMDWGLAKWVNHASGGRDGSPSRPDALAESAPLPLHAEGGGASATVSGTIMGTPQYMSPEQARGEVEDLDSRSDISALGAVLFHLLYLRPPYTGRSVGEIVDKAQRGAVEWNQTEAHSQRPPAEENRRSQSIPDSLFAVCRKALALDRDQRYWTVEELQADLTAYQNGFATRAENAGLGKQLVLALKRHRIAASGVIAVLLVGVTLGTKALLEGRRAEHEAIRARAEARRAEQALADLRKTAPTLLTLAESEAGLQHFASALEKLNAALALDPTLTAGYWRRGWILLAQENLPEAVTALRIAAEKDPGDSHHAQLLPLVEKMAAVPEAQRHTLDLVRPIYTQLGSDGARGEAQHFVPYVTLERTARLALVRERIEAWLGKSPGGSRPPFVTFDVRGRLEVGIYGLHLNTLEPLRGLPIEILDISFCELSNLEPLHGMPLQELRMHHTFVSDLGPLAGTPLEILNAQDTNVRDLSPLRGLPLKDLLIDHTLATDLSPLAGLPLQRLSSNNPGIKDFSALRGMPLSNLALIGTGFADASVLAGMPLEILIIKGSPFHNLEPLAGLPLRTLDVGQCPIEDFTPLLRVPSLQELTCNASAEKMVPLRQHPGLRSIRNGMAPAVSVAEFWAQYDRQKKATPAK
jgi:serine/threonine protein kinase